MQHLFELVFEYRNLLVRRRSEGPGFAPPARSRLDALHRLLGREPFIGTPSGTGTYSRRLHARCDVELRALLRTSATLCAVDILNLGAGGVCAVTPGPLQIGDRGVLHLVSPESGRVYECTAEVCWTRSKGQHTAGLRFIGPPVEVLPAS